MKPVRLASEVFEKVWGSPHTEPFFQNSTSQKVGEIWFKTSDDLPLLVKFLFTSENLSIQNHPDDTYAAQHHQSSGKTEMWHILQAEPGARVALGLKDPEITREDLRRACPGGEIEGLLNWYPAQPGDSFFVPAGTIHAIGGGLTICEIQQRSNITYRLFDWNRPNRELHLDHGIRVARLASHAGAKPRENLADSRELLAACDYFRTERLAIKGTVVCPSPARKTVYIAIEGDGVFHGEPFRQGDAWEIGTDAEPFEISSPGGAVFLTTTESF